MARGERLTRRSLAALAGCAVLVLVGHGAVLAWLERHAGTGPALMPVASPVFTRLLAPAQPPPPPAPPPVPAPSPVRVAPLSNAALAVEVAAPAPQAAASAPERVPAPTEAATPAPAPAASAPPASAPVPPAAALAASTQAPVVAEAAPAAAASSAIPAASAASVAPKDTWPPDTRLTYRLEGQWRGGALYGSARVQWQRQGAQYQAQVDIDLSPFTYRVLTSQGDVTAQGLVPRLYEERSRSRRRALRLGDADITLADGRTVPRPADVQDTASQFVELGHRFAIGRQTLALGETVTLWLARPGGVDAWTYDVVAQDLLQIPRLGEVPAWRLRPRPLPQRRDNLRAEIWFAPSLQYLPVRIRLALGDEAEIDLKVDTIEQR